MAIDQNRTYTLEETDLMSQEDREAAFAKQPELARDAGQSGADWGVQRGPRS